MKILDIHLYGKPHAGIDSMGVVVNRCTKKEVITYSAAYTGWKNDILKQLRHKYKLLIDYPVNIEYIFYLDKKEKKARLELYARELWSMLNESKVLTYDCASKNKMKWKEAGIYGCQRVNIIITKR